MAAAGGRAALLLVLLAAVLAGSEHLVGAPEEIRDPENNKGLRQALSFAMVEYNNGNNDRFASKVVRIISARSQVVSGLNYIVEVEIAKTTCLKPPSDLQSCPVQPKSERTICDFTVYVVPWENHMELMKHRCRNA
ncbi:cystatin-like [Phaenicophaeus curvirostris]|uniref:cystatin-like n=1 Tax=Phaenicophaeus curvirostris TaxID=33595 RepID=UPI0037F0FAB3